MTWEIDRNGLHQFIDQAIDTVMSTPMPMELVEMLIEVEAPQEIFDAAYAAWISAGLSVEVGDALKRDPERFIIETD